MISQVGPESDAILRDLFTHYLRDMAEWFRFDAATAYDAAAVWADGRTVYLATMDSRPAGFALTGSGAMWGVEHDVQEFFILPEFRRCGIGQRLAAHAWDQNPGDWLVRVLEANAAAVMFWRSAISGYSAGAYQEEARESQGRPWRFFRFRSA